MGWRREIRDLIAQLEADRQRACEEGTPEGARREEQLRPEL